VESYTTDEETVEQLRKWWSENGAWILAGLVLGGASLFGWRYWTEYREQTLTTASNAYEQVMAATQTGDVARATALADEIRGLRLDTPYGELAALAIAGQAASAGEVAEAMLQLSTLVQQSGDEHIVHVARLRLARLQLAEGHLEEAAATLQVEGAGPFAPLYAELRGDLALARGDHAAAIIAYREALASGDEEIVDRAILELKLNDLGVSVDAREA
jgi:predicted negative regulator of RcsB-dependent stress response